MSSCLCHISPGAFAKLTASASAMVAISAQLPPPLKLQMAANVSASASASANMAALAARLPKIDAAFGGPGLMQLAATLRVVPGTFNLMDPIQLNEQLAVSAGAVGAMPPAIFSAVAKIDVAALAKVAAVARLVAQIKLAGIDPFAENFAAVLTARASAYVAPPALPMPALARIQLIAGLPALVQAFETLTIPLGDPAAVAPMFQAKLAAMAQIRPPSFPVSLKLVLKAAAVMEMMATINAAFGPAVADRGFSAKISAMMSVAASASMNVSAALPPLLPPMEDILLGEKIAGSPMMSINAKGLTPPRIAIMPVMAAMIGLKATLSLATGVPPVALCTVCGSS